MNWSILILWLYGFVSVGSYYQEHADSPEHIVCNVLLLILLALSLLRAGEKKK